MRIALISTPYLACPPANYGGTELIIHQLADAYVKRGHEVLLYATADSRTRATLKHCFDQPVWPPDPLIGMEHVTFAIQDILKQAVPVDVVHGHDPVSMLMSPLLAGIPFVYTVHHAREDHLSQIYQRHSQVRFVFISERQRALELPLPNSSVIYHGLSPEAYPFSPEVGDYLVFLGRFAPYKGPLEAIAVARKAGLPLCMGGRLHREDLARDDAGFLQALEEGLRQPGVAYLGAVGHARKVELLSHARALLFPVRWEEPFGLVMIESMLCGTPVLAFEHGSVPELIEDGVTGFIVRDEAEMLARLQDVPGLDRARIRDEAVRRFSGGRMAEEYLALYASMLARRGTSHEVSESRFA
ncbi:glycosyltransferase family 4 protein [Thermithiobacillus plumbiphilus]|uniref:Glycosyltransferase family 4 protein n=1 Tax=Thermithiobacillus plumbiphilus TaxID=1729899 RepID=A0ABU9D4N3_9PROT